MSTPTPTYANFGKYTTDLFKKRYDFDPITLKASSTTKNGFKVESGAVNVGGNDKKAAYLRGYNKFSIPKASWGSGELEVHTDSEQTSKISSKFTKLYPGLVLTKTLANKDKASLFKGVNAVGSLEAQYVYDSLTTTAAVKTDLAKWRVEGSASLGYDNYSAGASIAGEISDTKSLSNIKDLDIQAGAEYTQNDLSVSCYTTTDKDTQFVNVSLFQKISPDFAFGALWKRNLVSKSKPDTLTIGSDAALDKNTGLKTKLELPTGTLSIAVQQRFVDPQFKLGVATEFDVSQPQAPQSKKVGFTIELGDF